MFISVILVVLVVLPSNYQIPTMSRRSIGQYAPWLRQGGRLEFRPRGPSDHRSSPQLGGYRTWPLGAVSCRLRTSKHRNQVSSSFLERDYGLVRRPGVQDSGYLQRSWMAELPKDRSDKS